MLYDLCGEAAQICLDHGKPFAIESAASRRYGPPKCRWDKYANNGFLWDFPSITALDAEYLCYAQCAFSAPYQKYTGLLVSRDAAHIFHRFFDPAQCHCAAHSVQLRGYDSEGVARTHVAREYTDANCAAFVSAMLETCGSNQEGERSLWTDMLNACTEEAFGEMAAVASCTEPLIANHDVAGMSADDVPPEHPLRTPPSALPAATVPVIMPPTHYPDDDRPLNIPSIKPLHPLYEATDPMEFWMEDADGAYKVSEVGSLGKLPTTVAEAEGSPHWPLYKAAMVEEIKGKMANRAFEVVRRPSGVHVLKSKWVWRRPMGACRGGASRSMGCAACPAPWRTSCFRHALGRASVGRGTRGRGAAGHREPWRRA